MHYHVIAYDTEGIVDMRFSHACGCSKTPNIMNNDATYASTTRQCYKQNSLENIQLRDEGEITPHAL